MAGPTSETARLLARARRGERDAFDALLARHHGRLLAWARARTPAWLARRVTPRDIVQETLLEATRKIDAFEDRGPSSFYRWLVGIARFKLAEAARAARATKRSCETTLDVTPVADQTSLAGRAARAERASLLRAELDDLPSDQARAVRLRYLEGLSVRETASRLDRSEAAVKALVSRGLDALARRISPES